MDTHDLVLEAVDSDGAVREAAEAVGGDSRADFFRKAGVAAGGTLLASSVLGALPGVAAAKGVPKSDIAILNYALTLEYLEAAFYHEAVHHNRLHGKARSFAHKVARDEAAHVAALKKALGSKAVKRPKFDFQGIPRHQQKFLETSFVLENTGVHAYLGQAGRIKTPAILLTAATIVTVEARHSGAVGELLGKSISPSGAFDTGESMSQVLAAVKATGFIKG
jgi:rubrerythrin